jgi:hypothetical protein
VRDPIFTSIQNNRQNYGFAYFNLYIPRQQAGRQKSLERICIEGLPGLIHEKLYTPNFILCNDLLSLYPEVVGDNLKIPHPPIFIIFNYRKLSAIASRFIT